MAENGENRTIVEEKWGEILEHVRREHELSDISFSTWLQPLSVYHVEGNDVTVFVPTERVGLDYVSRHFFLPLKVAVAEVTGQNYDIHFTIPENAEAAERTMQARAQSVRAGLNPKYTFDTFVVGDNNKVAHAAALAVAESPGQSFNPLFLYGGSGLGKTHLMNAIAHYLLETRPELTLLCINSNDFTNEFIDAIRDGKQAELANMREKYLNVDVFLVDDIQYIIGRDRTQEEFFYTFNALYDAEKQIILTSDRPPKDMEILDERFRSRFVQGLMVDIQSPDYETRMAILKRKRDQDGSRVSDEVLEYIATNIKSNIRELEGALNKIVMLARLENQAIDVPLAEKALADIISPDSHREITPAYIIDVVAEHFNITPEDILSNSKSRRVAYPRQVAMYLCREMTSATLQQIAAFVGVNNHTTVMHGANKVAGEYQTSDTARNTIDILIKKINPPSSSQT